MAAIADSLKTTTGGVFEGYSGEAGVFDEAVDGQGRLREAYRAFAGALPGLTAAELKRRHETARRIIQEQRITYNVHGDPLGMDRLWRLDPLPLLICADEWDRLEIALIQRATLLNLILADCYGPQTLIQAGLLPRRWSSASRISCCPATVCARRAARFCTSTRPIWRGPKTANGGCCPTGRKSRPGRATRWPTG